MRRTRIAISLTSDLMIIASANKENWKAVDAVLNSLSDYVNLITRNESLESFIHRRNETGKLIWSIAFSEHEAKNAILDAIIAKAQAVEKKYGLQFEIKCSVKR